MNSSSSGKDSISLSQLNRLIRSAITDTLPDQYWVVAEIAEIKLNQKGHCYLELVEKQENTTIAQIRATIWAYEYRPISSRFRKETNETLKQGMKILLLASVSFHEVYGLSLNIRDIDPSYTIGEMAKRRKEIIERLTKEKLIGKNRALEFPLVPQRIGVISSPTAAGYGDFTDQLKNNPYGYTFTYRLFPALMQGPDAEASVISALDEITKRKKDLDIIVIIRGGGSVADLSCFDSYPLAAKIAASPLPVITGIGHEKDDTVADIVAHTKLKTPTAVAEFIISSARGFEESVLDLQTRIAAGARALLEDENSTIGSFLQRLSLVPLRLTSVHLNRVGMFGRDLGAAAMKRLQTDEYRLGMLEQAARHLDPSNVLRRGYSITRYRGKALKNSSLLNGGEVIETELHEGRIRSIIQKRKEGTAGGKEQGDDLLPGIA